MDYTKDELEFFGIHGLRKLGREIGVKAPSSLKKVELIENILNVQKGVIPPHVTNKGRPTLQSQAEIKPQTEYTEEEIKLIIKKIIEDSKETIEEEMRKACKKLLEAVFRTKKTRKKKNKKDWKLSPFFS